MSLGFRLLVPASLLVLLSGCAAMRAAPRMSPQDCSSVLLEPAPVWNASAAWRPQDDQMVVVDPEGGLLEFSSRGEFRRRVEPDGISAFDFSHPVRLLADTDGYLLGGPEQLLWLDQELLKRRVVQTFDELPVAVAEEGLLSDFVQLGGQLVAYADFQAAGAEWRRGLIRLDGGWRALQVVHEFTLEQQEEWNRYYHYEQRPYLAAWKQRAYWLRLADSPAIYRVGRKKLELLWQMDESGEDLRPKSVYAWRGAIFVLLSRRLPAEESEPELETPAELLDPESVAKGAELLAAEKLARKPRSEFWLLKIDPKNGRRLATFVLPSSSISKLLPGDHQWAIIEGSSAPNLSGESSTYLRRFPTVWLAARDGATHRLVCAEP